MLGDESIPIAVRTDWVWSRVAQLHPEVRRENFVGLAGDPYMVHDLIVDNVCRYTPRHGHRVMDIGANVGVFTAFCALNGARVAAYEPDPEAAVILQDTVNKNHVDYLVEVHPIAVWTSTGSADFWRWHGHSIIGTMSRSRAEVCGRKVPGERSEVETISLADAVGQNEWDCVKVDVEGGEFELLTGASDDTLRRIRYLTLELHNDAVGQAEHDALVARLERIFSIDGVRDGSPEYKPESRWISIYATLKEAT